MKKVKTAILISAVLFYYLLSTAYAGEMENEIDHLVKYIGNSGCTFIRNDEVHGPAEAVDHILRKYGYFKDDIKATEDFIDLCATKSTVSKKDYYIKCGDQEPVRSKDWLTEELRRYRAGMSGGEDGNRQ